MLGLLNEVSFVSELYLEDGQNNKSVFKKICCKVSIEYHCTNYCLHNITKNNKHFIILITPSFEHKILRKNVGKHQQKILFFPVKNSIMKHNVNG